MPDVPGNTSTSYWLSQGVLSNALETNGDIDYFKVNLVAGYTYDFQLIAEGGTSSDMRFELLSPITQVLDTNYDGGRIGFTATESGTYYLRITDHYTNDSLAEGNYFITSGLNDDVIGTTATQVAIAGTGSTTRTLGQSNDVDMFRVNMTAGLTYDFSLIAAAGSSADMRYELLNSLGEVLSTNYDGGTLDWTALTTGTYFLRIRDNYSGDEAAEGQYTIVSRMGDTIVNTTATTVVIGGSGNISSNLDQSNDVDMFRVTMIAGRSYDFSLTAALGTSADMRIELLNASGQVLRTNYDGGTLDWTAASSGTYFIRVRDNYSGDEAGEGAYTITARMGDTILNSAATTFNIGGSSVISSDLGQSNDSDWFRVNLVAGRSYGFQLTGDGSVNSLDDGRVQIVTASGQLLDTDYTGGTATLNPATSGTYYVIVSDYSNDEANEGNYRLTAQMSDTIVNNVATTSVLARNGSVTSTIDAPNDTDWFKVSLREGLAYGFKITGNGTNPLSDPDIYLRDTNGADILVYGNIGSGTSSTISWTADQSGTYFVQAGNMLETDLGGYKITSIATDTIRGDTATAATLLEGEKRLSRVDVGNDVDWFEMNLVAGRSYTFKLNGNGAAPRLADRFLALYDEDGARINAASSSGSSSSVITFTATESGTFYLGAQGYYSTSTGNYTISVGSNASRFVGSGAGNDMAGNGKANVMLGYGGADKLAGLGGNDVLRGGTGRDMLLGGGGNDRLFGDAGADTLNGHAGDDILTGGRHADLFIFARNGDHDVIRDFTNDVDTIRLAGFGLSSVQAALNKAVQVGDDVVFDFGRGDTLTVEDTTLSALRNDLLV